ncbi:G patch domain and ankyrin repeat-containing protein 1 homolog [Argiope bruennichi]|uniref:G patch domain and ankyrin repeat-containing protein 1 homolog n=1 Tax=Argiope bruennichi TaxID=94029 RepID=UPI0024942A6A|nr:G patch domain and ankyrin repeat-containing protein 1 homolog [Argiope bruennichi]
MSAVNSLPLKLIPFVLPSDQKSNGVVKQQSSFDTGLSGSEVSQFYESVVSSSSCQKPTKKTVNSSKGRECLKKLKKSNNISQGSNIKADSIFLYAQQGNITGLKQCIENGLSINQQDAYGWTPLMCAACEGHFSVVEYLLKAGANPDIRCKYGMTVIDIARKAKNDTIIKLLQNGIDSSSKESSPKTHTYESEVEKFCSDCKASYKTSTIIHERSIAHLIMKNKYDLSTFYHIPENNKGFQIMLKSGWDKNKGLGPNADGRKFPIKTVLKKDRSCIGKNKEVPKVTHFDANDETAVKTEKFNPVRVVREKTLKKWERKKLDAKNRQREIDFRRSFNTDF